MNPYTSDEALHPANDEITPQLPQLHGPGRTLDPVAADDLVQDTVASALLDPSVDLSGSSLAMVLARLAGIGGPALASPVVPTPGSDPDADEAELFFPGFYTDGPDAGAWV